MISDLNADKLLIQAEDGDAPSLQDTSHFLSATRGLALGILIFALATPVARIFSIPQATWAFYWLALVPVVAGLKHQDVMRMQRQMRFERCAAVDVLGNLASLLCAWPLVLWLKNYGVVLWLLIIQTGIATLASWMLAIRPYRWTLNRQHASRLFGFGWPLLLNGVLLFGILQGDRVIIGMARPMGELGLYAIAFSLTMAPSVIVAKIAGPLLLPVMAHAQNSEIAFSRQYAMGLHAYLLCAAGISMGFIVAGEWTVRLLYGSKYAAAGPIIGVLATMHAVRLLRGWLTLAAMAKGDTRNSAIASGIRVMALFGTAAVAYAGGPLLWIAISGLVGELLAMLGSLVRLKRLHELPLSLSLVPISMAAIWMVVAAMVGLCGGSKNYMSPLLAALVVCGYAIAALSLFPGFREGMRFFILGAHRDDTGCVDAGSVVADTTDENVAI
jgi:O-antigen/teichoic acid export membrane protein